MPPFVIGGVHYLPDRAVSVGTGVLICAGTATAEVVIGDVPGFECHRAQDRVIVTDQKYPTWLEEVVDRLSPGGELW